MKPKQILPEPTPKHTKEKLFAIALFVLITITVLHAREMREQWKDYQIELSTGGNQ